LPTKITCDASQHGLGATLKQQVGDEWHPVFFASRTMTSSEINCQLEKEMLSAVFACNKFHEYIYGRAIIIENNHKPLMSITQKHLNKAPSTISSISSKVQIHVTICSREADNSSRLTQQGNATRCTTRVDRQPTEIKQTNSKSHL